MRNDQIQFCVTTLREDSPLIRRIRSHYFPGAHELSTAQRLWYATQDAAFGAHLTVSYFASGEELPEQIRWPGVRRAYACLEAEAATKHTDPACHEALALGLPINVQAQAILKGLLCSGLNYLQVAERLGMSVDVIRIFANLFCDFPERCESGPFVKAVLHPQSEPSPSDLRDIEDPVLRAMNIGFHFGPDVLCRELRLVRHGSSLQNEVELLQDAKLALLNLAGTKAKLGGLSTDSGEFMVLKLALSAQSKQQANVTTTLCPGSPEAMSMSKEWQSMVNNFTQKQVSGYIEATKKFQGEDKAPEST